MNEQNRIEIGSFIVTVTEYEWIRLMCKLFTYLVALSLFPLSKHNVLNKLKEKDHVCCYIAGCVRILIFALGRTVSCRDANFLVVNMVFVGSRKQTNRFLISDNDSDKSDGRYKLI